MARRTPLAEPWSPRYQIYCSYCTDIDFFAFHSSIVFFPLKYPAYIRVEEIFTIAKPFQLPHLTKCSFLLHLVLLSSALSATGPAQLRNETQIGSSLEPKFQYAIATGYYSWIQTLANCHHRGLLFDVVKVSTAGVRAILVLFNSQEMETSGEKKLRAGIAM